MKMIRFMALAVIASAAIVAQSSCQTESKYVPDFGNIGYEGARLYGDSQGKQALEGELLYGEIVEFDSVHTEPFIHVKNIATGQEGYIDTLQVNRRKYPLEAPFAFDEEQSEAALLNIQTDENGEVTEGWSLWNDNGKIRAFFSLSIISNSGRMQTIEKYYIGEAKPGYVVLTNETDYNGEIGELLEKPIVIYEDIADRAGIFVNGKIFTPGGQVGGFDTDDWD